MKLADLLTPDRIACDADASSKKRLLESISELLCKDQSQLSPNEVFDRFIARERLGSTGLGHGIAIPHGRIPGNQQTLGAFVRLNQAIDYDSSDGQPVDLLFALLVPEEATEEHLQTLAKLAKMFSNEELTQKLRQATSGEEILKQILAWEDAEP